MTPREIAQLRFASLGGLLTEDALSTHIRESVVKYAKLRFAVAESLVRAHPNTREDFPSVYFFLLDGPDLNAYALEVPPIGLIGLKLSALGLLGDYFRRVLCMRTAFPEIGEPSLEIDEPSPATNSEGKQSPVLIDTSRRFQTVTPKCPKRAQFAIMLMSSCLDFLVHHELAHLRMGHSRYLAELFSTAIISEAAGRGISEREALTRQTLELNADVEATAFTVSALWHAAGNPNNRGSAIDILGRTPTEVVVNWAFAVFSLWRCFEPFRSKVSDHQNAVHPHPITRQMYILDAYARVVTGEPASERFLEQHGSAIIGRGEGYYSKLYGDAYDEALWPEQEFAAATDRVNVLVNHWHLMRNDLAKYAYLAHRDNV